MANHKKIIREVMNGADAEFLLQECKRGKFNIRLGRIWKVPKLAGHSTLLLDYDAETGFNRAALRQRLKICGIETSKIESQKSPSGKGLHVRVHIKGTYSPFAICALQAICESDLIREAQNFRRALCMPAKQWFLTGNVLFTK